MNLSGASSPGSLVINGRRIPCRVMDLGGSETESFLNVVFSIRYSRGMDDRQCDKLLTFNGIDYDLDLWVIQHHWTGSTIWAVRAVPVDGKKGS